MVIFKRLKIFLYSETITCLCVELAKEGEIADMMAIVKSGECRVLRQVVASGTLANKQQARSDKYRQHNADLSIVITFAKEVFYPAVVCLSVCLSVYSFT